MRRLIHRALVLAALAAVASGGASKITPAGLPAIEGATEVATSAEAPASSAPTPPGSAPWCAGSLARSSFCAPPDAGSRP